MKLYPIVATCLAFCLMGSAVSVGNGNEFPAITASAEEEVPTSGTCGQTVNWNFDKETGTLTISGTGKMERPKVNVSVETMGNVYFSVTTGYGWDTFFSEIKSVIVEEGVTNIYNYAFYCCTNLKSAVIPNSVTSIGRKAFGNCRSLASVTVPATVTSIGEDAFLDCFALDITILNKDCKLYDSAGTVGRVSVIHGYSNSTAQSYAGKYSYQFESIEKEVRGDINNDGQLSVADLIQFNQQLHNRQAIPQKCDMNNDNIVNVIDLSLMKKALLNK